MIETDLTAVEDWFTLLYGGLPEGELVNIVRTDNWSGVFVPASDPISAMQEVMELDLAEPVGIYHRVTSVTQQPENGRRGDMSLSSVLPGFWADLDIAGPGHKSKGELPQTRKDAVRIITNSCLPEPTLWVDSGGGLYPWWLLDEPYQITEEKLAAVARLSDDIGAEIQRSARELGMEYAPMQDLARVLRVPGTINRKVPGEPRLCQVIKDGGERYGISELREIVPATTRKSVAPNARNSDLRQVFDELPDGPPCRAMLRKLSTVTKELSATETGGRHAAGLSAIGSLLWMGNVGHAGAREALDELRGIFDEVKPPVEQGPNEWDGMVGYIVERMEVIEDRHCCGEMTFSDAHLAARVVREELKHLYIWATATGWLRWTGKLWQPVSDAAMTRVVSAWLISNYRDAVDVMRWAENSKAADEEVKAWKAAMSANRINGLISLSRGLLEFDPSLMDADPDLLNTPAGVIHLPSGDLLDHDPSRYISKITSVPYDPDAKSERFDRIMSAVPAHSLAWLQIKMGQAATGYPQIGADPNVIAKGSGFNGKTTVFETITQALGSYAVIVPKEVITGERSQHEIMQLWGTRLALTEELPEGARLNTEALKRITDTPTLQGRWLYKDLVTWHPTHTLFVTTNPLPQVAETTHAVWRRLALVIFPHTYVAENRELKPGEQRADPDLRRHVHLGDREILTAALRWVVDGARLFYGAGQVVPPPPPEVQEATRDWRKVSDVILAYWDEERITAAPGHCVTNEDLYADFVEWTTLRGNKALSSKVFGPMFAEHQETRIRQVFRDRPTTLPGELSRPDSALGPVPQRPSIWTGVRFVSAKEEAGLDDPFNVPLSDPLALDVS